MGTFPFLLASLAFLLASLSNVSQSVYCSPQGQKEKDKDTCTRHAANNLIQNSNFINCKLWNEIKQSMHSASYYDGAKTILQKTGYVFEREFLPNQPWVEMLGDAHTDIEYYDSVRGRVFDNSYKFVGFWISVQKKDKENHQTVLTSYHVPGPNCWYLDSNDCGTNEDGGHPYTGFSREIPRNPTSIIKWMVEFVGTKHGGQYRQIRWIELVTLSPHLQKRYELQHAQKAKKKEMPSKPDDQQEDIMDFLYGAKQKTKEIAPKINSDIKTKQASFKKPLDVLKFWEDELKTKPVQQQLKAHKVPIQDAMQEIFGVFHQPDGVKKTIVADGGKKCDAFCESTAHIATCTITSDCIASTTNQKKWCHSKSTDILSTEEKTNDFVACSYGETMFECIYQIKCNSGHQAHKQMRNVYDDNDKYDENDQDVTIYNRYNQYYNGGNKYWALIYALIEVDMLFIFLLGCGVIFIFAILVGGIFGYIIKYNSEEATLRSKERFRGMENV